MIAKVRLLTKMRGPSDSSICVQRWVDVVRIVECECCHVEDVRVI